MDIKLIKGQVKWRDLVHLTTKEKFIENTLFMPWLAFSMILGYFEFYILAVPFTGMYFLTALRQSHNGYHYALGINKFWTGVTLFVNSIFMLASLTAVKHNHIKHHQHCLEEEDYERVVADKKWYQVLFYGIPHLIHLHKEALMHGTRREKRLVCLELLSIASFICVALVFNVEVLLYHLMIIGVAELMLPFFTVWLVHHGCDYQTVAKTQRNKFLNLITMNMLLHLEHHMFPSVPAIKLKELSRRIDQVKQLK